MKLRDIILTVAGQRLLSFEELEVEAGQIVTLLGPSGSGKSSLLKALAGVTAPEVILSGQTPFDGLPAHQRGVGYVDQRPVLFPHLNVVNNVAFGLRGPKSEAVEALERAGLSAFAKADPASLSGGQAARVALMRTLLSRPQVLLMDEPFSALDPELRTDMRAFVFAEVRARSLPTLLVTHDGEDAKAAGGPIFALENQSLVAKT